MIFPWSCCTWSCSTAQPKHSENPINWIFLIRHFGFVNLWFPVLSFKQNKTISHILGLKTRERETLPDFPIGSASHHCAVVQLWSCVWLLVTLWTAAQPHGLPCPSLFPWVCSNSCSLSQWCHPTISSSVVPFSFCLQSFPASESFPMSQLFASGGQSIGSSASASVLPMTIQGWFPLGQTGWISLQSKLESLLQHHSLEVSVLQCSAFLWSNSHWKNQSFDYTDLCQQSNVSAF